MQARTMKWIALSLAVTGLGYVSTLWSVQEHPSEPMATVSTIVSVEAKHGKDVPVIYKDDVRLFHEHERLPVVSWTPCQSDQTGVELFLLIDDSSDTELGLQLADLKKFINDQPAQNTIGVGYIRNGTVEVRADLTGDHGRAAKALRLPLGSPGISASPYLAIKDLIQRWPVSSNCHEIFMVSSGIDVLQPGPTNTYLDEAIERAQRAGIQVNAIYASETGHIGHTLWRLSEGQSNLSRLADETGGEAYFQGLETPVSYRPFLSSFADRLGHQHQLTFLIPVRREAGFQKIRLETEVPNAELDAAEQVYVPGTTK